MATQRIFIVCSFFVLLISCKSKKTASEANSTSDQPGAAVVDPKKDSADIRQQVLGFYDYYNKNYKKFQEFDLYRSKQKQDQPPYEINWAEVNKLNAFIRNSVPYLGEAFIKNQTRFLEQADSAFKVDLTDDIPYGFDYDWYTNSQEDPQYLLDEINKSKRWVINVKGEEATADIKTMFNDNGAQVENSLIKLGLKKESGAWKISKIGID